jgi:SPP1 gp7 family putative phage head morphogenesis protein
MTSTIFSVPHLAAYTTLKPRMRPLRALRPLRIPRPIESWYRKELMAITDRVTSATEREIIPLLKAGYVESASDSAARTTDAPPPGDYTNKTAVHEAVKRLETQHDVPDSAATKLAAGAATQVSNSVDEKIAKEAVRSVAINIRPLLYQTTELGKLMRTNIDANVNLIKSIPTKHFQRLEKMLNAGLSSGLRPEAMAKQIQALTGISKRRAKFIARDQTAKMLSQFNGNRQQELGIKQYIWQTAEDERVRPEHAALNGKLCSWSKPPLHGLNPGEDYNCLPGFSKIEFADGVKKAFRRWYRGELTEIVTASGKTLRATPNHPVLTRSGWCAIGSLKEGDEVVEVSDKGFLAFEVNNGDGVSTIAQVFAALQKRGTMQTSRCSVHDFHGDGTEGNVDVVTTDSPLCFGVKSGCFETLKEFVFTKSDYSRFCDSALAQFDVAAMLSANRVMGGFGKLGTLFLSETRHANEHRVAFIPSFNSGSSQACAYNVSGNADTCGDREFAFASLISGNDGLNIEHHEVRRRSSDLSVGFNADASESDGEIVGVTSDSFGDLFQGLTFIEKFSRVVKTFRREFSGFVHNLETERGWYVADGIIIHNCRCIATPVFNVGGAAVETKQVAAIQPEVKPSMVTASWVNGIIGASIAKGQLSQAFKAVGKTDMSSAYSANEEGLDKLFKKGSGKYADNMDKMLSMSIVDFGDETPPPTWFGSKYTSDSVPFNTYYWDNGRIVGGKDFDASRTLEAIEGLNWLFDRHLTSVPMKTFRGISWTNQDVDKIKRRLEEFGIYEIPNGGYGSTSRSRDVAIEYARKNASDEKPSKVLFELMIPSGYHALSLDKITTVKTDKEFLLLHSFNYHVFGIRYENDLTVLEATVKPIEKSKPVKDALPQKTIKTYKKQKHLTYEEIIKLPRVSMGKGEFCVLP